MSKKGNTLTLQETADKLGVHYNTIYRWVQKELIPSYKLGGQYRIREEDIEALTTPKTQKVRQVIGEP